MAMAYFDHGLRQEFTTDVDWIIIMALQIVDSILIESTFASTLKVGIVESSQFSKLESKFDSTINLLLTKILCRLVSKESFKQAQATKLLEE